MGMLLVTDLREVLIIIVWRALVGLIVLKIVATHHPGEAIVPSKGVIMVVLNAEGTNCNGRIWESTTHRMYQIGSR